MEFTECGISLTYLKACLDTMIKEKSVNGAANILWAKRVQPDIYNEEFKDISPGSVLFGLEWMEDGEKVYGTLKIEPCRISRYLN